MKILLLIVFIFAFSISTLGAVFIVNNNGDTSDLSLADGLCLDVNGNCTLRAAVQQANSLPGDNIITFDANIFSTPQTITLSGGAIIIHPQRSLIIYGTGASRLVVTSNLISRVFDIGLENSVSVTINDLTIAAGSTGNSSGGCILKSSGTLIINNSVIKDCVTSAGGGGIDNDLGTLIINNSTINNNSAYGGGGIISGGTDSVLLMTNSTVSGNTASFRAGGISNVGSTATFTNVSVVFNSAVIAGGIYSFFNGTTTTLRNSMVAKNTAESGNPFDFEGTLTSQGYNLIGNTAGATIIGTTTGNITGRDPLIALLQNNGGTTPTHALMAGSPAIDKGNNALAVDPSTNQPLLFDQRGAGFSRIIDGDGDLTSTVDIGAYEKPSGTTAANATISGRVTSPGGRGVFGAIVTLIDGSGETRSAITNPFGYYSFNVESGESYTLSVRSKRFSFTAHTFFVSDSISDIDFIGEVKK